VNASRASLSTGAAPTAAIGASASAPAAIPTLSDVIPSRCAAIRPPITMYVAHAAPAPAAASRPSAVDPGSGDQSTPRPPRNSTPSPASMAPTNVRNERPRTIARSTGPVNSTATAVPSGMCAIEM